ncbi:hypothetical protein ACIA98_42745 [Streptomyces sp. NPDC051366]|uniref:hypothetical protein n=1 Tax=Streptomyces sp. NPDC051366 TaxID=3365652 RepID=UPI003792969D
MRPRDPQFLHNTPVLAETIREAQDDGRHVFDGLERDWATVRSWAARLPKPSKESIP